MGQTGKNIAIYSRKSRFTGKGESIGNQVELCRGYIRSNFGEKAAENCVVFEDEGFSGGDLKRPAFQQMLEGVRQGKLQAVVVYRLDRISRNISDFAGLVEELARLGAAFISIREQFDTGNPMGRAMMYIISVFSQLERETIAERIRDNMHQLAKTGRWLGGNTPTGFTSESVSSVKLDGKARKLCRLKLLPEEAQTVKMIFDLYLQLDSLTAVEAELLRRQLKTKRGNDFTRFALKGILENPVYMTADALALDYFTRQGVTVYAPPEAFDGSCGIMAYNRTDQQKGSAAVQLPMEEWIVSVGEHPGLIPAAQWIRVQGALKRNSTKAFHQPRKNAALLTGLLFCRCGSPMYPKLTGRLQPDGIPMHSYVCRQKLRSRKEACACPNANGQALDAAVWGEIEKLPIHWETFRRELENNRRLCGEESRRTQQNSQTELRRNESKLESLLDALSLNPDTETKQRITLRMEALLQANRRLRSAMEAQPDLGSKELDALHRTLGILSQFTAQMSPQQKRQLLRETLQRITWDGTCAKVRVKDFQKPERACYYSKNMVLL